MIGAMRSSVSKKKHIDMEASLVPTYIAMIELEDAYDAIDDAVAEMEDVLTSAYIIEMEDGYYDAESVLEAIGNAVSSFVSGVVKAVGNVISAISNFITGGSSSSGSGEDSKVDKLIEAAEKSTKKEKIVVTIKGWRLKKETMETCENTLKICRNAVEDISNIDVKNTVSDDKFHTRSYSKGDDGTEHKKGGVKATVGKAVRYVQGEKYIKELGKILPGLSDSDSIRASIQKGFDNLWFEKGGKESKEVTIRQGDISKWINILKVSTKGDTIHLKSMIKQLESIKKDVQGLETNTKEGDDTVSKNIRDKVKLLQLFVNGSLEVGRSSLSLVAERRRDAITVIRAAHSTRSKNNKK